MKIYELPYEEITEEEERYYQDLADESAWFKGGCVVE